jgi:hypothetical protein
MESRTRWTQSSEGNQPRAGRFAIAFTFLSSRRAARIFGWL